MLRDYLSTCRCFLFTGSPELAWHNNLYRAFNMGSAAAVGAVRECPTSPRCPVLTLVISPSDLCYHTALYPHSVRHTKNPQTQKGTPTSNVSTLCLRATTTNDGAGVCGYKLTESERIDIRSLSLVYHDLEYPQHLETELLQPSGKTRLSRCLPSLVVEDEIGMATRAWWRRAAMTTVG